MVDFNNLSEGEKFAFSEEFLIKFKVVQKLKPTLTDERDILYLVADKFYDGNTSLVKECIEFIDAKAKITSLNSVDLDTAVEQYQKNISKQTKEKESEFQQKSKKTEEKQKELEVATNKRNASQIDIDNAKSKISSHKMLKLAGILGLVLVGCSIVAGAGGVVGLVNGVLAFVGGLGFVEFCTLIGITWGGWKVFNIVKDKLSARSKAKQDSRDKALEKAVNNKEELSKKQKEVASELANAEQEKSVAENEYKSALLKLQAEKAKLEQYRKTRNFERGLTLSTISIKEKYNQTKAKLTSAEDKANLDAWYKHFEASLYAGAYLGEIKTKADMQTIIRGAGAKFDQIADPLSIKSIYNEANVKRGADPHTNRPLEELYQAI